jgi:hypothetical protein
MIVSILGGVGRGRRNSSDGQQGRGMCPPSASSTTTLCICEHTNLSCVIGGVAAIRDTNMLIPIWGHIDTTLFKNKDTLIHQIHIILYDEKASFLNHLRSLRPDNDAKWIVFGDFNFIYSARDKNNRNLNLSLM